MARNDDPAAARRAQDVVGYVFHAPSPIPDPGATSPFIPFPLDAQFRNGFEANKPPRAPRRESTSSTHVGRGGAANVFKPSAEEIEKAKRDNAKWESAVGDDDSLKQGATKPKGLADKGKEWLMGRK
jgi:hypothetical protein